MSYSERAKIEIAETALHSKHNRMSFLSGLIRASGSLLIASGSLTLIIITTSEQVKDITSSIIFELYKVKGKLTKNAKRYELEYSDEFVNMLLVDCKIIEFDSSGIRLCEGIDSKFLDFSANSAEYVKGAFVGAGSVGLKQNYHLEFSFASSVVAQDFSKILFEYGITAKILRRQDKAVVYLKDSESISDCLALMGANKAVLELNGEIAKRAVAGYTNRFTNCEVYNLGKTVNASVGQSQAIKYLNDAGVKLDYRLSEASRVRLENPDSSLEQIAEILGISKSGIVHRLNKIMAIYKKMKNL